MTSKRILQSIVVIAMMAAAFASAGSALAWSGCARYVTVHWGDTLSGMAVTYGTTVYAIRAANPGMGWWLYAGQVICIPAGTYGGPYYPPQTGSTYVVQRGDTLYRIAVRYGVSLSAMLAVNPQIWNANFIYTGQVINLPTYAYYPPPSYPSTDYPPPPNYPIGSDSPK
ncbi:MAG: LysM peptidoglycan-binding domain-containing protein [Bacteroidota bacterium]